MTICGGRFCGWCGLATKAWQLTLRRGGDTLGLMQKGCLKFLSPDKLVKFRVRDNEANVSGSRHETRVRTLYEFYKSLQIYRNLTSFDDLVKVFPSAAKFYRNEDTDMGFLLAMVALEEKPFGFTQLFGLDILFEAISDPKRSATIKRLYNFDYKSFIELTGQHDVFSGELIHAHAKMIAERDGQIGFQQAQISALVAERDRILDSTSWKITKPLRILHLILTNIARLVGPQK